VGHRLLLLSCLGCIGYLYVYLDEGYRRDCDSGGDNARKRVGSGGLCGLLWDRVWLPPVAVLGSASPCSLPV